MLFIYTLKMCIFCYEDIWRFSPIFKMYTLSYFVTLFHGRDLLCRVCSFANTTLILFKHSKDKSISIICFSHTSLYLNDLNIATSRLNHLTVLTMIPLYNMVLLVTSLRKCFTLSKTNLPKILAKGPKYAEHKVEIWKYNFETFMEIIEDNARKWITRRLNLL